MLQLPNLPPLLTVDDFLPHVGSTFVVDAVPKSVAIRLERIEQGLGGSWTARQPFMLTFSSDWSVLLIQANYRMQAPSGDQLRLDLVPTMTPSGPRRFYHAVFN